MYSKGDYALTEFTQTSWEKMPMAPISGGHRFTT